MMLFVQFVRRQASFGQRVASRDLCHLVNLSLTVLSRGSVCYQNAQLLCEYRHAHGDTSKFHLSLDIIRFLKVLCISMADET
jgi:hypothetical protein